MRWGDDDSDERKAREVEEQDGGGEEAYRGYGHMHLNVCSQSWILYGPFYSIVAGWL